MRTIRSILCAATLLLLQSSVVPANDAGLDRPPRYDLTVGRQLTWSLSALTENQPPATNEQERTTGSLRATVLRANGDGSRRIVFRFATTLVETARGQEPRARPEYVRLSYADVFPDGRMLPNATIGAVSYAGVLFPLLPAEVAATRPAHWVRDNPATLERFEYAPLPEGSGGDPHAFLFRGVDNGPMMKIYQTTLTHTYRFDRRKGIVADVKSRRVQTYGYAMTSVDRLKLESDERLPASEAAALAAEYDRLFDALQSYGAKLSAAENDPARADAHMAEAEALMKRAAAGAESALVKDELHTILEAHPRHAKYIKDRADRLKEVIDRPAPDWASSDIDGNPVELADLRGKVVVLDFWYRMCGPCLLAMPQVKHLAAEYKNKPVVVLGMNTDQDVNDARFVIETFQLNYPTLKASELVDAYGVVGFPALFIIDPQGVVRDVHVGHGPDLRAKVGRKIDELLSTTVKAGG